MTELERLAYMLQRLSETQANMPLSLTLEEALDLKKVARILLKVEKLEQLRAALLSSRAVKEPAHCRCGVAADVSHYCSALDHCWIGKREPPNPYREHLAANGKPIDGYPEQQA